MAIMQTYDLKGKKLSFANWISNLSPTETPFVSMTGKEAVNETKYSWQTDSLTRPISHAVKEGSDVTDGDFLMSDTVIKDNYTQILRKVVKVTDTANLIASYGRGRELQYQMEKAGLSIKRDLEAIFLSDQTQQVGSSSGGNAARKTSCFQSLVAAKNTFDPDTGAKVHFDSRVKDNFTLEDVEDMQYNLFLSNSKADIIMFHPKHASMFANIQDATHFGHMKIFTNDNETFSHYVKTIIDSYGREFKLIPNRFMPEDVMYFFNAKDFTQMVLRAPTRIELAKEGSYEQWMIEMEVGLRLDNPFAAGVIKLKAADAE